MELMSGLLNNIPLIGSEGAGINRQYAVSENVL